MLVPSLACPAECSYCFGPHRGPVMSAETLESTLDFMARIVSETGQRKVKVTFHGGEPLLAGHALWRQALDGLQVRFGAHDVKVALQSNLWFLDDEFCALFRRHRVEIGTSLDGPEPLSDAQRGHGYFARTLTGIRKAQSNGMSVGCIATFTPHTLPHWREVFDFFRNERISFSIHAAVPPLNDRDGSPSRPHHGNDAARASAASYLSTPEYASLLRRMLDYYVEHRREFTVSSFDQMCQGLGRGEGGVCTFRDCLGMFLAIDPSGDIYPCQRFCAKPQYRLGTLAAQPTLEQLFSSPTAQRFSARQEMVRGACHDCAHLAYCKGGCPYNSWASRERERDGASLQAPASLVRDPYCAAYRETFDYIRRRLLTEVVSEENIKAVAKRTGTGHLLLRRGALIELVREGPHPRDIARTAKRIVAAVELAKGPDLRAVAARLVTRGISRTPQTAEASLINLRRHLHPEQVRHNNLYLHTTFACQLRCTHCYAHAGNDSSGKGTETQSRSSLVGLTASCEKTPASVMSVSSLDRLIHGAHATGFRQVVITGGEPLTHPQRGEMLVLLAGWRRRLALAPADGSPGRKMNIVLRTNFAMPLNDEDLRCIAAAFDQVVASVDGSAQTHDARRGKGTYSAVLRNLEAYVKITGGASVYGLDRIPGPEKSIDDRRCPSVDRYSPAELSLACVMRAADIQGEAGDAVRQLSRRLGIRRTRFRPLLPLGRARDWDEPPISEALGTHADPLELIESGFHPVASCGLGQNLYVEPSGESFPCYAYHRSHAFLGNVIEQGLSAILASERFRDLAHHTVDTNPQCCACDLRYLCGGACRAWGGEACQHNLDVPPPECDGLRARAEKLLAAAIDYLDEQASSTRS